MMFRQFPSVVIPFTLVVASAACSTETLENQHIFANPIDGGDSSTLGWLMVESHLPMPEGQALHVRLNGRDLIWGPEDPTFVEILDEGGGLGALIPVGDYEVQLVDRDGKVWTTAGPVQVLPPPAKLPSFHRQSFLRLYGDAANPTAFIHAPIPADEDEETSDLTVRNARASGQDIELQRCVTTAVDGSNPDCEVIGHVAAGDTWTGSIAVSHAAYPFVGEAWVGVRGCGEGDDPASFGPIFPVNDPDEGLVPACQASAALITDVDFDGKPSPYAFWECGSY
jgi:hypothetical protein